MSLAIAKLFMRCFINLYKQRNLLDSQKKPFLDLLRENIENFKYFMGSQSSLFIKACSFYLDDLSEEDVKSILDDDTYGFGGSYLLERDKYTDKVQKAVDLYKNAQLYTQLKKKWNDLTGTVHHICGRISIICLSLPWFPMMKSQQQERYLEL